MRALTAKQETFAQLLAKGMSASDAYRTAYEASAMSGKSVREQASRLANHPGVAAMVLALSAPTVAKVKQSIDVDLTRVIFENARIGFSDVRRLFGEDGQIKAPGEWDDDFAASVASIKVRELFGEGADGKGQIGTVTEVKLWDKGAALDRLMKHLGGYAEDNKQKGLLDGFERERVRAIIETIAALRSGRTTGAIAG
jgi:phage terminase small subunit